MDSQANRPNLEDLLSALGNSFLGSRLTMEQKRQIIAEHKNSEPEVIREAINQIRLADDNFIKQADQKADAAAEPLKKAVEEAEKFLNAVKNQEQEAKNQQLHSIESKLNQI